MRRVELQLETVTPAFLGASEPEQRAEWTAKSIRGHLRWWLRAIAGGQTNGDGAKARARESALFGSNEQRSAVRILVRPFETGGSGEEADGHALDEKELAEAWGAADPAVRARLRLRQGASNPIGYLGYGPITYDRQKKRIVYQRARIRPNQKLTFFLQWRNDLAPEPLEDLRKTLWCWLNLGGVGGRSRRGFGSLACLSVRSVAGADGWLSPVSSLPDFEQQAVAYLTPALAGLPPASWSYFTTATRIFVSSEEYKTWQGALTAAGAWLIAFRRRYGLGSDERTAKRNRDYVWLNGPRPAPDIPDRAGFGLPLLFGKVADASWRDDEHDGTGRRGSPLLIHVARFGAKHHLVLTHMPALLVPQGAEIHFYGRHKPPTPHQKGIVDEFLDDLAGAQKKKIRRLAL